MSYTAIETWIEEITADHITVALATGEKFVLPFERYGWFPYCTLREILNVECDGDGLSWPDADIDLEVDLLRHPEKEGTPWSVEHWMRVRELDRQREAMRAAGTKGGSVKSEKKSAASRKNGALGGRPKKKPAPDAIS